MVPPAFPRPTLPGAAVLLLLASGLSGCGADQPKFAPACPDTHFLADGADLTRFRSTGTDITDMVVDGRITGGKITCSSIDPEHVRAILSVNMELTRGPAMEGRTADVTYFVALSRNGNVLNELPSTLHVTFERNSSKLRLTGEQVEIILPTPGKVLASDYRVDLAFRLTPDELAFNRRRGPR